MVKIMRLTRATVNEAIAARYWKIVHQLSDMSHVSKGGVLEYLQDVQRRNIWVFGSFEDDLLVAVLSIHFDYHPWGIEARVQNVATDEPYRQKGHYTRLFMHAFNELPQMHVIGRQKRGVYKLTLSVSNPIARQMYEDDGFKFGGDEMRIDVTPDMFPRVFGLPA